MGLGQRGRALGATPGRVAGAAAARETSVEEGSRNRTGRFLPFV